MLVERERACVLPIAGAGGPAARRNDAVRVGGLMGSRLGEVERVVGCAGGGRIRGGSGGGTVFLVEAAMVEKKMGLFMLFVERCLCFLWGRCFCDFNERLYLELVRICS